jgi:DNA-binding protein H-NS
LNSSIVLQGSASSRPRQVIAGLLAIWWNAVVQLTLEIAMVNVNLSRMTVESLIDLRKRIDETLVKRRAMIEKQLEWMDRASAVVGSARGGGSTLKGKKVPPKYRGPSGETWAGRGARPRWLVAAIKGGKKLDDFVIDKSARNGRRKRRSKR